MESVCSREDEEKEEKNVANLTFLAEWDEEDEKQYQQYRSIQPSGAMRVHRLSSAPRPLQKATKKNQARRDALVGDEVAKFKWCTGCRLDLADSCYSKATAGIFGLNTQCRTCRRTPIYSLQESSKNFQEMDEEAEKEEEKEMESMTPAEKKKTASKLNRARSKTERRPIKKKFCGVCLKDKELEAFWPHSRSYFKRRSKCIDCMLSHRSQNRKSRQGVQEDDGEADDYEADQAEALEAWYAEERSAEANRLNGDRSAKSTSKWCCNCLVLRPLAAYGINRHNANCYLCLVVTDQQTGAQSQTAARYMYALYCR
jgi:hypothetical protein